MWVLALVAACCLAGDPAVYETTLDGAVYDIKWTGPNNEFVFIRTYKNSLYRSADEGKTWTSLMDSLPDIHSEQVNGYSGISAVYISPADSSHVLVTGFGTVHWVSRDYGATWKKLTTPTDVDAGFTQAFLRHYATFHPSKADAFMIALTSPGCVAKPRANCYRQVYATMDFGASWRMLNSYVVSFAWANETGQSSLVADAVFMTEWADAQKTGSQKSVSDADINFVRSLDLFATKTTLLAKGNDFRYTGNFLFVVTYHPLEAAQIQLYVSTNDEVFDPIRLPPGLDVDQQSYRILDTETGAAFLFVKHGNDWGNIYVSNADGTQFALSLQSASVSSTMNVDFFAVPSVEGIYTANMVVDPEFAGDDFSGDPQMRSMISFDRGGEWQLIAAPERDSSGSATDCHLPTCSLHLHGRDGLPGFYSVPSAVGLIIASGNVGSLLDTRGDVVNTYFSRDGGLTWVELRKGLATFEYGDHGAILILANLYDSSTTLLYSWDEGETFTEFKFTSHSAVEVDNVIVEPSATSDKFILYGTRGEQGVAIFIDFSGVQPRACQGAEDATADYETWSATDGRRAGCLLGHDITYVRRKRDALCYNPVDMERITFRKDCDCDEDDWECDYGFMPSGTIGTGPLTCMREPTLAPVSADPPLQCPVGTSYNVTKGYRKVGGDTCVDNTGDRSPSVFKCPGDASSGLVDKDGASSHGALIASLVLVGLLLVVGSVAAYWKREWIASVCQSARSHSAFAPMRGGGTQTVGFDDDDDGEGARHLSDGDIVAGLNQPGRDDDDDEDEEVFRPLPGLGREAVDTLPSQIPAVPSMPVWTSRALPVVPPPSGGSLLPGIPQATGPPAPTLVPAPSAPSLL